MESGHVSGTDIGSDLKTQQVANPSENNHVSPDNNSRLSSSNSSSSSLSGEVIQLSSTRTNTSDAGVVLPLRINILKRRLQLALCSTADGPVLMVQPH